MTKILLNILYLLIFSQAATIYQSDFKDEPWAFKIQNTAIGTITYGITDNPLCSKSCKRGEFCRISKGQAVCRPYCGDGIVTRGEHLLETCDDGNQNPFDGCNRCRVSPGWFCGNQKDASGNIIKGSQSTCTYLCGDGQVDVELGETCDDGNNANLDGCSSKCRTIQSWNCVTQDPVPPALKGKSKCDPRCGDGKRVGIQLEQGYCDDGNQIAGDGCSNLCRVQKHFACRGVPSLCTASCGNGIWNQHALEECDNGEKKDSNGIIIEDGCIQSSNDQSLKCTKLAGWNCENTNGKPTVCKTICGDGLIKGSEKCDDGNNINGDGCTSQCQIQLGWLCKGPDGNAIPCKPICGDGIRVGEELYPRRCDDANDSPNDGCVNCQTQRLYTCTGSPSKCEKLCGNGLLNAKVGQECDNGVTKDSQGVVIQDGCDEQCTIVAGWKCNSDVEYIKSKCVLACGDGIVDSQSPYLEECDTGATPSADCVNCKSTNPIIDEDQLTVPLIITRSYEPNQFYQIDTFITSEKQDSILEVKYNLILAVKSVTESGIQLTGSFQQISQTVTSKTDDSKYVANVDSLTLYYDLLKTGTSTPVDPTKISSTQQTAPPVVQNTAPIVKATTPTLVEIPEYFPVFRASLMRNGTIKAMTFHKNFPKVDLSTLVSFIKMFSPALKAKLYLEQQTVVDETVLPKPQTADNSTFGNRDYFDKKSEKFISVTKDNGDVILIKQGNYSKSTNTSNCIQKTYSESGFDSSGNLLYTKTGLRSYYYSAPLQEKGTVRSLPMDFTMIQNSSMFVKERGTAQVQNLNQFESIIKTCIQEKNTYVMSVPQMQAYTTSINSTQGPIPADEISQTSVRQLLVNTLMNYQRVQEVIKTNIIGYDISAGGYASLKINQFATPFEDSVITLSGEVGLYLNIGSLKIRKQLLRGQITIPEMSYKYTYDKITTAIQQRQGDFYNKINPIASLQSRVTDLFVKLKPSMSSVLTSYSTLQGQVAAFRKTLDVTPIVSNITAIQLQSLDSMSTTLQPIKAYLAQLLNYINQFVNTQIFGQLADSKTKIAAIRSKLATDSSSIQNGVNSMYTTSKNSLLALATDQQKAQLEQFRVSTLNVTMEYFNYINTRSNQVLTQIGKDTIDMAKNLSGKVLNILKLPIQAVQVNLTKVNFTNQYNEFQNKLKTFLAYVPPNALEIKNTYVQTSNQIQAKNYYTSIKNMKTKYAELQSKMNQMVNTVEFPAGSACDFKDPTNSNTLSIIRFKSATALLSAEVLENNLMNSLNVLLPKLKKIIDLNLSARQTLQKIQLNSNPDSLDSVDLIGQRIFGLNRVEVRIWKNNEGYQYHQLKKYFLDLDDYFNSQILESELDYQSKLTEMDYFYTNCYRFLVTTNKITEQNIYSDYKQLLLDIKNNYTSIKSDYFSLKKNYLDYIESLYRQSYDSVEMLSQASEKITQMATSLLQNSPAKISTISSSFTTSTNSIRNFINTYQSTIASMCSTSSFNSKYRLVETYPTEKRAIDQLNENWNSIIQIVTEISTVIQSQSDIATIETLNTKITSLMNQEINIAFNQTFSAKYKWPTALIIDQFTLLKLQAWDLQLIDQTTCPETAAAEFLVNIRGYVQMLRQNRLKIVNSLQLLYNVRYYWNIYYLRSVQNSDPINLLKSTLRLSTTQIIANSDTIVSILDEEQTNQKANLDSINQILVSEFNQLTIDQLVAKDKLPDQYLSLLLDSLSKSDERRAALNQVIDLLNKSYDSTIADVVEFAKTQPAENQAKISEFKALLQTSKNNVKPIEDIPQIKACYDKIVKEGIITVNSEYFAGNVSQCAQQYVNFTFDSYVLSSRMFDTLRDIFSNLTTNITVQKTIIETQMNNITSIITNKQPFNRTEIFNCVNLALNATLEAHNVFRRSQYDISGIKSQFFGFKILAPLSEIEVRSEISKFSNESFFNLSLLKLSAFVQPNTRLYPNISFFYPKIFSLNYSSFEETNFAISLSLQCVNYLDNSSKQFLSSLTKDTTEYNQIQAIISSYDANNQALFPSVGRVNDIIRRLTTLKTSSSNYYTLKNSRNEANQLLAKYSNYKFTIESAKTIFTQSGRLIQNYNQYLISKRNEIYTYLPNNVTSTISILKQTEVCSLQPDLYDLKTIMTAIQSDFYNQYQFDISNPLLSLISSIKTKSTNSGQLRSVISNIKFAVSNRYNFWKQKFSSRVGIIQQELGKGMCAPFSPLAANTHLSKWSTSLNINFDTFWSQYETQIKAVESSYSYLSTFPMDKVTQWLQIDVNLISLIPRTEGKITSVVAEKSALSGFWSNFYKMTTQDSRKELSKLNNKIDTTMRGVNDIVNNQLKATYDTIMLSGIGNYLSNVKSTLDKIKILLDTTTSQRSTFISALIQFYNQIGPLLNDQSVKIIAELQSAQTFLKTQPIHQITEAARLYELQLKQKTWTLAEYQQTIPTIIGPLLVAIKLQASLSAVFFVDLVEVKDVDVGIQLTAELGATVDFGYGIAKVLNFGLFVRGMFFRGTLTPKFIIQDLIPTPYPSQIIGVRKYLPTEQVTVKFVVDLLIEAASLEAGFYVQHLSLSMDWGTKCVWKICVPYPKSISIQMKRREWTPINVPPLFTKQIRLLDITIISFNLWGWFDVK